MESSRRNVLGAAPLQAGGPRFSFNFPFRAFSIAVVVAAVGCRKQAPASDAAVAGKNLERERFLALMKPGGSGPADRMVEQAQARARREPFKAESWVALGHEWVRDARETPRPGFYMNANNSAEAALAIEPGNRAALGLQSLVLLNDHRFEEARRIGQQMVVGNPQDPLGWGILSDAFLELGQIEEANRAAQRMMDLKPNLPSYSRASYLLWLRGDVHGAKESARLAVDSGTNPRDPEPRAWQIVQTAMIFWHEGDYPGAEAGFELALKELPGYPPALAGLGRTALSAGNPKRAEELLERAWQASPLIETAWLLGDAREAAGDEKGARESYDRVVRDGSTLDPRTLALFLATKNRDAEQAVQLAAAELNARKDIYTEDTYAWALFRAGRADEARAAIDRATRLGTRDARLFFHAGAIRLATGDRTGLDLLHRALKMNPGFDRTGAAEALRLVDGARSSRVQARSAR